MKDDDNLPPNDKIRQNTTQKRRIRLRERAIANLLEEPTLEKAAAKTGVSSRTLQRWLSDLDFVESYRNAKALALERAMARLSGITWDAVDVLSQILRDTEASPNSRVSASRAVLDMSQRDLEISSLETRIKRLEDQTDAKQFQKSSVES